LSVVYIPGFYISSSLILAKKKLITSDRLRLKALQKHKTHKKAKTAPHPAHDQKHPAKKHIPLQANILHKYSTTNKQANTLP
jgi:hypothetical protein